VLAMWVGLTTSYLAPRVPPSFAIITIASGVYALTFLVLPRRRGSRASM
jgi:zinc/manganese transport system permease protein